MAGSSSRLIGSVMIGSHGKKKRTVQFKGETEAGARGSSI